MKWQSGLRQRNFKPRRTKITAIAILGFIIFGYCFHASILSLDSIPDNAKVSKGEVQEIKNSNY